MSLALSMVSALAQRAARSAVPAVVAVAVAVPIARGGSTEPGASADPTGAGYAASSAAPTADATGADYAVTSADAAGADYAASTGDDYAVTSADAAGADYAASTGDDYAVSSADAAADYAVSSADPAAEDPAGDYTDGPASGPAYTARHAAPGAPATEYGFGGAASVQTTTASTDHYGGDDDGTTAGEVAARAALTRLGAPYVYGATGPSAFDCSGLVQWAWAQAGVSIPRTTYEQARLPEVDGSLQPGDLVLYYDDGHVGMYVGDGLVVHAPAEGDVVKTSPYDSMDISRIVRPV